MAELATIARPYAEALFKASVPDCAAQLAWLDEVAVVAGDAGLIQFADSPKVTSEQVFDVIVGVVKSVLDERARNFLRVVIDNGRLGALSEIAVQYRGLLNAQNGAFDAVIYSAFDISDDELKGVATALEKRFERKLNVSVQLQPDLIGGIRVVVGDEVLDTSVKARLEQMKVVLTA